MIDVENKTFMNKLRKLKIVAIGGGTGISTMLRGIKKYTNKITAIITVADDGGGSGMLRTDMNMVAPGDVRNCMLALADMEMAMDSLLNYRFDSGRLSGQSMGNLILAAMYKLSDEDFTEAVKKTCQVLAVKGRVLPVTNRNVNLGARLSDGSVVLGESTIPVSAFKNRQSISELFLIPKKVEPAEDVIKSINEADLIVLGPGSLYTSIIPNILVEGVSEALKNAKAKKLYVCNIMTQKGETDNYTAYDHVRAINSHAGCDIIDYCIVNDEPIPDNMKLKYKINNSYPVVVDAPEFTKNGIQLFSCKVLDVSKGYIRHDYDNLAEAVMDLCYLTKTKNKRER